jgi:Tfp pilus assembly protein PilX
MKRLRKQSGMALIMMIGIVATLATLAATAVVVTANTQHSTAAVRTGITALDYAEAGLTSGVLAVQTHTWPATNGAFSASDLAAAYNATYPSGSPLTVQVYDNQSTVNKSITWDQGSPTSAATPDGKLWVQAAVTYNGKTAVVRQLVGQANSTGAFVVPAAAIYTDSNVKFTTGGGDAFGITSTGAPDTNKSAAIMAGGSFSGNWNTDLSPNGGAPTLTVKTNGTVTNPKLGISNAPGTGGVPPLNTVITPANVATLTSQAQQGSPTQANSSGAVVAASTISGNTSYTASSDVVVNGDLTLGAGTRSFKSLYVNGNLTQNGGGTLNCTALYVQKTLTITSTSGTCQLGPTYVGQDFVVGGGPLSIMTTNYTVSGSTPGPLYVAGNLSEPGGGAYTHSWGSTYVGGDVTFAGNSSQILCPLMVTPGVVTTGGSGSFGTQSQPMVLLGLAGSTAHTMQMSADAVFTGLLVNMDGGVNLNNDGNTLPPNNFSFFIDGAVMATGDVQFTNNGNVGYDQTVLANLHVTAGTTTTTVVPGTWQQLSPSGN